MAKADNHNATTDGSAMFSLDAIRQSLKMVKMTTGPSQNERRSGDPMSLSAFKSSLKLKPAPDLVIGGLIRCTFRCLPRRGRGRKGDGDNGDEDGVCQDVWL